MLKSMEQRVTQTQQTELARSNDTVNLGEVSWSKVIIGGLFLGAIFLVVRRKQMQLRTGVV